MKAARNALCPCGSGKKYKRCHGSEPAAHGEAGDASLLISNGLALHHAGSPAEAEKLIRKALAISPGRLDALNILGVLRLQQGSHLEAASLFEQGIKASPREPAFHFNCGEAYRGAGDCRAAIRHYSAALDLNPGLVDALLGRATSYRACKQLGRAIGDYERAIKLQPGLNGRDDTHGNASWAIAEIQQLESWDAVVAAFEGWHSPVAAAIASLCGANASSREAWKMAAQELATVALTPPQLICAAAAWTYAARNRVAPPEISPLVPAGQVVGYLTDTTILPRYRFALTAALEFDIRSDRARNQWIFENCVLPALRQALDRRDFLTAGWLEDLVAFGYMQQPHTEEQAALCLDQMLPMFAKAASKLKGQTRDMATRAQDPPCIAFIHDLRINASSPSMTLLRFVAGLLQLESLPFVPLVVGFAGVHEGLHKRYAALAVEVVDMDARRGLNFADDDPLARAGLLGQILDRKNVSAVVFVNAFEGRATWLAALRLAPVQLYWSMGYRMFASDEIDGYLAFGAPVKSNAMVNGRRWRIGPGPIVDPYSDSAIDENRLPAFAKAAGLAALRETMGAGMLGLDRRDPLELVSLAESLRHDLGVDDGTVLLGSIGRAQKIDSDEFLLALAKILLSRPNTKFLWFGDSELASVRSRMKKAGISERCLFQGHVTVEIYAKVLDIHLDSFPFPTGLTMCDTLSAGRAFVWLDSDVTQANGVPPLVVPLVKGILGTPAEQDLARSIFTDPESAEPLLPLARDAEHFVQLAVRMIDDPVYRAKVGQAGQNYMRNFLLDIRAPARVFSSHIQDVVSEVKARYAHDAAEENTGVR